MKSICIYFGDLGRGWKACVTTVTYSYLVNDSVYGEVQPSRGIRQGDPMSPYLFILCGEVLSGLCKNTARDGSLQGVRVARGCPRINHLLFADDTMFFCQSSAKTCDTLVKILARYGEASGQRINKSKSSITFSSKTPPEHFGRRKKDLFTSLVDKIRQRAQSLSTRFLSRAGKLTMLKSTLTAAPTYTMSCFLLPVSLPWQAKSSASTQARRELRIQSYGSHYPQESTQQDRGITLRFHGL